jgi:hypothetical protein
MNEADTVVLAVHYLDDDGTIPKLKAFLSGYDTLATFMKLVDSGNGTGLLYLTPGYTDGSTGTGRQYYVLFQLIDAVDPTIMSNPNQTNLQISVRNKNQPPTLTIPAGTVFTVTEGQSMNFLALSRDPDRASSAALPTMTAVNLPTNASFISYTNLGDTSVYYFAFEPDYTQAGVYNFSIIATDYGGASDTVAVQITVLEAGNQTPYFTTVDSVHYIPLNIAYTITLSAVDPDDDSLILKANKLLGGATFTDLGNGTCRYVYTPLVYQVDTVIFTVTDYPGGALRTKNVYIAAVASLRGDMDSNNKYTMNDMAVLIAYMYRGGPAPENPSTADINADGELSIVDITYLIRYLYHGGPPPPQ